MHTLLSKIAAIIIAPIMFIGGLFTHDVKPVVNTTPTQNVGATLPTATGVFETSLASAITSTATSMTLSANSVRGGGSISGYTCLTVDEGSPSAEIICGTVSSTSVTSLTRGVSYADGVTSVAANKFSHRRGANVKITDFPILQILKAQNNGDATFENAIKYASGVAPSTADDLADKGYVDGVVVAGGVDASTSTKGISKLSVAPASPTNPIAVGDNDTRLPSAAQVGYIPTTGQKDALVGDNTDIAVGTGNKYVTQTGLQHNAEKYAADAGSNDTYVITLSPAPTSYTNGMIVYFKANTINTGAATINVNSLGAKTIVKGVNSTLSDGDIAAGQFCTLIYDGTNFVLQNPTSPSTTSPTVFQQTIIAGVPSGTVDNTYFSTSYLGFSTSNPMFAATKGSSGAPVLTRYIKLYNGSIVATHQVQVSLADSGSTNYMTTLGNYVYMITNRGGVAKLERYDAADLTNETEMTISGTAVNFSSLFTNGTNLYQMQSAGSAQIYSISGTTATAGSTVSYTSSDTAYGYWSDGTTLYAATNGASYSWPIAGGSRTTGPVLWSDQYFIANGTGSAKGGQGGIFKEVGNTSQILTIFVNKATTLAGAGVIGKVIPVTTF